MNLLTFSTLFPNAEPANHGLFVETRLRCLVAGGKVESRELAPVPQFPLEHALCGRLMADRSAASRYTERFSCATTTQGHIDVAEHILAGRK